MRCQFSMQFFWLFQRYFGYLEETKLFTYELRKHLNESECKLIMELPKRYMDVGFAFWPLKLNFKKMFK